MTDCIIFVFQFTGKIIFVKKRSKFIGQKYTKNLAMLQRSLEMDKLKSKQVFCDKKSAEYVLDRIMYNTRPKKDGSKQFLRNSINKTIVKSRNESSEKKYTTYTLGEDPTVSHFENDSEYSHLVVISAIQDNDKTLKRIKEYTLENTTTENSSTYVLFAKVNFDELGSSFETKNVENRNQVLIIRNGKVFSNHIFKKGKPSFILAKKAFFKSKYISKLYKMYKIV